MGQRTQVLVIKENNKGERKSTFFHEQWGFGRIMYMSALDLFMQDYNKDTWVRGYNFLDSVKIPTNQNFFDITNDVPRKVLKDINPDDFATIARVFDYGDNNNGGMVVYIKEKEKVYGRADFKIGFLLGWEDTYRKYDDGEVINADNDKVPFSRWLTPEEYGKMNGGSNCSDPEFVEVFKKFTDYFGIEFFENKNIPEKNISDVNKLRDAYKEYVEENYNDGNVPYGYEDEKVFLLQAKHCCGNEGEVTRYDHYLIKTDEDKPLGEVNNDGYGEPTDKTWEILCKATGKTKEQINEVGWCEGEWKIIAEDDYANKLYDSIILISHTHSCGLSFYNDVNVY